MRVWPSFTLCPQYRLQVVLLLHRADQELLRDNLLHLGEPLVAPGHEEVIAQALPVDDDISNGVLVGVSLGQPTDNIDKR